MKAVRADPKRRVVIPGARLGDIFDVQRQGEERFVLVRLHRFPVAPRMSREACLDAMSRSPLNPTLSWEQLRRITRGPWCSTHTLSILLTYCNYCIFSLLTIRKRLGNDRSSKSRSPSRLAPRTPVKSVVIRPAVDRVPRSAIRPTRAARFPDLHHRYASNALDLGESLTMIGKLLGHTQVQTTARYTHLARDSIQNAAARITGSIGGNLSSV